MNESNIMLGGKEESSGATIGTIIVIIILLIGGGYILWSRQGADMPITPATETSNSTESTPVDPVSTQMGTQSQSANLADIEADLKATDLTPLDQDLKNIQ